VRLESSRANVGRVELDILFFGSERSDTLLSSVCNIDLELAVAWRVKIECDLALRK
jgi:hypothetical protein